MYITMKFINLLIICLAILATSCSEDFIELAPISEQSIDNFFKSAEDIEQAVLGTYDALQSDGQYGGISGFNHFMEVTADNSFNPNTLQTGGSRAAFDNFSLDPTNLWLNNTWIDCYTGINRCNTILNRIDPINMDANTKAIRIGEVKFIRALTYFNLVRIWGDVPLIIEERENVFDAFQDTRTPASEVYQQIIQDLTDAIDALPIKGQTAKGRATKGAAQALLGKVYLTLKQWNDAVNLLDQVVNSPAKYTLEPKYANIFSPSNENGIESIFEVEFLAGSNGEGNVIDNPDSQSDGNNKPAPNYFALVSEHLKNNPNDVRPDVTIDTIAISGTTVNAFSRKFLGSAFVGSDGTYGFNIIVLRYADVLLMLSEALNEQGYTANGRAFDLLNQVRRRAGANDYTATDLPNQQSFRDAIAKERRLELAFENHRWFDLVRTNKAIEVLNAANSGGSAPNAASALGFTLQPFQLLFPIPQAQIDASARKITQNTGY